MSKIDSDVGRFKKLVRGKIRENLKDFIGREKMITQNGAGKKISIPLDYITQPHFTFGGKGGGTGQGSGEDGSVVGNDKGKNGKGKKGGKDGEGDGSLEAEFDASELAQILRESLELPRLEKKGKSELESEHRKYNKITNVGNESLRHMRRTYKNAIKRVSSSKEGFDFDDPKVVIEKQDKRYRASSVINKPDIQNLIYFFKDCSGSMSDDSNKLVRAVSFWIDLMLRDTYGEMETVWGVFDTEARVVDRNSFFALRSGGGTKCSSSLEVINNLTETKHPFSTTNIFIFVFSDGGNYDSDNSVCIDMLNEKILPNCNQFSYIQVQDTENLLVALQDKFANHEKVALASMLDEAAIMTAIKTIFTPKG